MKKNSKIIYILIFSIIITSVTFPVYVNAHSYSGDYQYWSQGGSDYSGMRSYGCWVTAQAKLLYETNIDRTLNPDSYFLWQLNNGLTNDSTWQYNGGEAPVIYASQKGKELNYLGAWKSDADQLWFNINAGYYTIVKVNNGGHYVMLANSESKSKGTLYCYDSWSDRGSIGPQPLSRYGSWNIAYTYQCNNAPDIPDAGNNQASISYSNLYTEFVDTWNAGLYGKVDNPGKLTVSEVGVWIWDSSGNLIIDYKEHCGRNTSFEQRLNIVGEALPDGLKSGEAYTWQMFAISNGNVYKSGIESFTITDNESPVISNVQVKDITPDGYTVTCTITDNYKVEKVQFPTWTDANGQDDLVQDWENDPGVSGTKDGDTYTFHVNISDHNNENGTYKTHIYAWDKQGNLSKHNELNEIIVPERLSEIQTGTPAPVLPDITKKPVEITPVPSAPATTPVVTTPVPPDVTKKPIETTSAPIPPVQTDKPAITPASPDTAIPPSAQPEEAKEYTITFDANGGSCETSSLTTSNKKISSLPKAERNGYTFDGWYTDKYGGTKVYIFITTFYEDTTLYAKWKTNTTTTSSTKYNNKPEAPSIDVFIARNSKGKLYIELFTLDKVNGYQIQYSKNKKFSSSAAKKTIKTSKYIYSKKYSGLQNGKKYYVRARAYVKYNGKKIYGAWSSVKKVKIHKK